MMPHSRPSTLTGTPTTARRPNSRTASAIGPEASRWSSIRAAAPVWNTSVGMFRPPSRSLVPTGKVGPVLLQLASIVLVPSGSYRAIDA
jgi:hypothetical protein